MQSRDIEVRDELAPIRVLDKIVILGLMIRGGIEAENLEQARGKMLKDTMDVSIAQFGQSVRPSCHIPSLRTRRVVLLVALRQDVSRQYMYQSGLLCFEDCGIEQFAIACTCVSEPSSNGIERIEWHRMALNDVK